MTDQTEAPERWNLHRTLGGGMKHFDGSDGIEVMRVSEAQAMVAAAWYDAFSQGAAWEYNGGLDDTPDPPDDALAALDRVKAEARLDATKQWAQALSQSVEHRAAGLLISEFVEQQRAKEAAAILAEAEATNDNAPDR